MEPPAEAAPPAPCYRGQNKKNAATGFARANRVCDVFVVKGQPPLVTCGDYLASPVPTCCFGCSAEQFTHGDDLLRHLDQFLLAAHGLAAHQGVGLFLIAGLHFHQHALGQLDALALGQLLVTGL